MQLYMLLFEMKSTGKKIKNDHFMELIKMICMLNLDVLYRSQFDFNEPKYVHS